MVTILSRIRAALARSPRVDLRRTTRLESDSDLRLAELLPRLRERSIGSRPHEAAVRWAHDVLELRDEPLADWCARATWSRAAAAAVRRRLREGRDEEVRELIEPFDFAELHERRRERGLLLVGAHLGPPCALRMALVDAGIPLLAITAHAGDESFAAEKIAVFDDARRRTSLLAARGHLERGGVVHTAADGRHGRRSAVLPTLGRSVEFCVGLPTLARVSRAPALTAVALWSNDRIRVEIGPPLPEPRDGENAADFDRRWLTAWAGWFEERVRNDPDNIRLRGGILRPGVGGVL